MHAPLTPVSLNVASLTSFDWFLVAILAISTVAAFMRGIIKVLFSLGGLIAGILLASWNYLILAERLHRFITSFAAAEVIAFLAILILVTIVFSLAARLVRRAVSFVGLGFFDRLLGGAFGLVRGLLFGVAAMMAIAAFIPDSPWVHDSRLAPWFLAGAHAVSFVVPQRFGRQISAGADHLLEQTPEIFRPHTLKQSM
jgi:membrane protein required for colicin V production